MVHIEYFEGATISDTISPNRSMVAVTHVSGNSAVTSIIKTGVSEGDFAGVRGGVGFVGGVVARALRCDATPTEAVRWIAVAC